MIQFISSVDGIYTVGELREALKDIPDYAHIAGFTDMGVAYDKDTDRVYIDNIPSLMGMSERI
jgi:hypothetical protein